MPHFNPLHLLTTLSLVLSAVEARQLYFYPGTGKTIDFLEEFPEVKSYRLYLKYCVEAECDLSVSHDFKHTPVTTSSTSRFTVLSTSHAGSYTLSLVSGDVGLTLPYILNVSASFLCMLTPQEYLSRSLPTQIKRGRGAVVPCPVIGEPAPRVTWTKREGEKVRDIVSDNTKYIITKLGHLFITSFTDSDAGFYSCSATNKCGERCLDQPECTMAHAQAPDYELTLIEEDPDPDDEITYYFLNPSTISCWTEDCFSYLQLYTTIYMFITPNSNVNVEVFADIHSKSLYSTYKMATQENSPRFISYSDNVCYGLLLNYTNKDVIENSVDCGAYTKQGMMSIELAKYELAISEPLTVDSSPLHDIVEYGYNFSLNFKVRKSHQDGLQRHIEVLQVSCLKNGEPFLMERGWHKQCTWDNTTHTVTISVICATDTDTGYYQVQVRDASGSSLSLPTIIETAPHTEQSRNCFSLRHTVLSSRSVRLEWDPPKSVQPSPLSYKVLLGNLAWKERLEPTHTLKLATVVKGLHPGVPYHAHVTAKGDLVGHRIEFRTHEEVPSAPPDKIKCDPVLQSTDLNCYWNSIPLTERNGLIENYKVRHILHYEWYFNFTYEEQVQIKGLLPFSNYTVEVQGCTAVGCGAAARLSVRTLEDKPRYRPTLRYIIPGARNVRVGWGRPPGVFKHLQYQVRCIAKQTGKEIFVRNVTELDAVVAGEHVLSKTEYLLSVTPFSTQGFGPTATTEIQTLSNSPRLLPSLILIFALLLNIH